MTATLTQNPHGLPTSACTQNRWATTPLWHTHIPTASSFSHLSPSSLLQPTRILAPIKCPPSPELQQHLTVSHLQIAVALRTTPHPIFHLSCHLQSHVASKHPIYPNPILHPWPTFPKSAATAQKNPRRLCLRDSTCWCLAQAPVQDAASRVLTSKHMGISCSRNTDNPKTSWSWSLHPAQCIQNKCLWIFLALCRFVFH